MKRKNGFEETSPECALDYSKAVRGKYLRRLMKEGANIAVLEPDVAKEFHDSAAVNDALRSLLAASTTIRRPMRRPKRTAVKRGAA